MTTTDQLDDAMKDVRGFLGTVPVDMLPTTPLKDNQSVIVNLQTSTEGGSHWVCCCRVKGRNVYFCPFGSPPDDRVVRFLGSTCIISTGKYQQLQSKQCGQFCVFFLRHLLQHKDMYRALYDDLRPDEDNERIVKAYFSQIQKDTTTMVSAYCLKCRASVPIQSARETHLKNGRKAIIGVCKTCGSKVSRLLKGSGLYLAGRGLHL